MPFPRLVQVWPAIHTSLVSAGLRSVTPEEAQALQGQGWTLVGPRHARPMPSVAVRQKLTAWLLGLQVDVRLAADYEQVGGSGRD